MICRPCRLGADLIKATRGEGHVAPAMARALHDRCEHCDCQHNVDAQLADKAIRR